MTAAAKKRDLTDFPEYTRALDALVHVKQQQDVAEARIRELTEQLAASRADNYAEQAEEVLGGAVVAQVSPAMTAEIQDLQRQTEVTRRAIQIGQQREGDARRKTSAAICDAMRAGYVKEFVEPLATCLRQLRDLTIREIDFRNDLERRSISSGSLPYSRFSGVGHAAGEGMFRIDTWEKDAKENYDVSL